MAKIELLSEITAFGMYSFEENYCLFLNKVDSILPL